MTGEARATARIDAQGRLQSADARLLDVLVAAGSGLGEPIVQPAMAGVVRLARRLDIALTRRIVVADGGEDDVELIVRVDPDVDGVTLDVSGWNALRARRPHSEGARDDATSRDGDVDWTWSSDASLCLTHIAARPRAPLDCDPAMLLGQPLARSFDLRRDAEGRVPILTAAAERKRFEGQPATLRATGRAVTLAGVPEIDANGRFTGFVGTARLDRPATKARSFAAHLNRALRLPLERIVANAGSLSAAVDGPLSESYAGYADDIATAGRHLLGLVTDLVDLETVERDDFAVLPEPIDLADVARRAAGLLTVRAGDAGVRIDRPGFDEEVAAKGDFRRALQVMVNLIGNAVRYSPRGGVVWVRAAHEDGRACVIVADQGKGIAAQDHALIFEKFGRVDPGEPGGSGLGLYISRRLARAMGGDLTVDSAAGQGARFVFTLPEG